MLWRLVSDFDFLGLFGGKMGVAATLAPKGLGPKNPTKKLAHVGVLMGHILSQNHVPEISNPGPLPLPPLNTTSFLCKISSS